MTLERILSQRWLLRASVLASFLPFLAVWVGWWTREVGRQPWVVYGLMRTEEGVSPMSTAQELFWLGCYMTFETLVWLTTWWFLAKIIRKGPDMTSPIPRDEEQSQGDIQTAPRFKHQANPT